MQTAGWRPFSREDTHGCSGDPYKNLQKIEFDVTTAEGPSRVTVVTGMMQMVLTASSQGPFATQKESYKVLLDPTLTPGQFRKASAIASFGRVPSCVKKKNAGEAVHCGVAYR